jgi:hypothetical protein
MPGHDRETTGNCHVSWFSSHHCPLDYRQHSPLHETIVPIDEAALAQNHDLIDAILNAKVSGPVMSLHEFKAWLDQQ